MYRLICLTFAVGWLLQPTVGVAQEADPEPNLLQELISDINRLLDERDRRFAEEWADRWRYYEVTISFSAEGNDYEITSQFACEPYIHGYNGSNIRYRRYGDLPAQLLPSGGALVFGVPFLCADRYEWERSPDGHLMPTVDPDPGYIPLAIWLNDAQSPSRAEIYISERYYGEDSSRLSIPQITVRGTPERIPTENGDAIVDISLQHGVPQLTGMFATVVPVNIWSTIPEVAGALEDFGVTATFSHELPTLVNRHLFWAWSQGHTRQAVSLGVPTSGSRFMDNESLQAASRQVFPILLQSGVFQINELTPGVIVLEDYISDARKIEMVIAGQTIPSPIRWDWQFEPRSGLLFSPQVQVLFISNSAQ